MKYPTTVQAQTKVLVAMVVVSSLVSLVAVTRQASHQATLTKQAEFEASTAIQLAARERHSPKVAIADSR